MNEVILSVKHKSLILKIKQWNTITNWSNLKINKKKAYNDKDKFI